jgi:dipeptidyl-peptidase-4
MNKSGCSQLAVAGLVSLFLTWPVAASAFDHNDGKKPEQKPATGLTAERISNEPDPNEQANSARWSPDGARVAWMHLIQATPASHPVQAAPGAHSPDQVVMLSPDAAGISKTTQAEIWSINPTDARSPSGAKPFVLVSTTKVTACLRGTDTPAQAKLEDEDRESNPNLLRDFAWSPDHTSLLIEGGQSLAWLNLTSGASRLLISGDDPISDAALSPDGRTVSFVRNHSLWVIPVAAGGKPVPASPAARKDTLEGEPDWAYRNELHMAHAYEWSPDSTRIAWLETNDHAVARYTLRASDGSTREIVYPKPGGEIPVVRLFVKPITGGNPVEMHLPPLPVADPKSSGLKGFYLPRIAWLPDGHHLAVERLDRRQHTLDLFVADVLTGNSRLLLTETDKYWINVSNDLHFLSDGKRFLWSSERTGFRHLYLYNIEGKQLAQLTHGDWEVTHLDGVDETAGKIYFTGTEKSVLERHLYQASLTGSSGSDSGSEPTRITQASGTHQVIVAPKGASFLDIYSNQTTPSHPELHSLNSVPGESADSIPDNPAQRDTSLNLQPAEFLKIKLHMGMEVNAFLIRPPGFDPAKKYPVIIYIAGGPGEQLVRDAWGGATNLWMQLMAQKGFLVFALDSQGSGGRGHFFEEPLHFRFSAQELIDQRDGLAYLKTQPYVDPERIGVCGWGYGGFLTVHAMLDRPVPFRAGFAGAPVTDWHFYDAVFTEKYLEDPVLYADGWDASTALENTRYFKGTLMIAQGTDDEFVHVENTLTLQDKLLDFGKSADIFLLPDRGHQLDDPLSKLAIFARMTDFFLKNL